ncbi:MAG: peptidoglycan DD-metalloendopeptidase family protein [Deltaproteobacteria bacterium]|jgi:septal ring factor EnvC (AmiA/AmiB activator)|nr:peptidoglycan DD-metalloendopeptidase family protein [Deltaproteobacteria bacterium]
MSLVIKSSAIPVSSLRPFAGLALLLLFCCLPPAQMARAAQPAQTEKEIQARIKLEEDNAKTRRDSLARLTQQERGVNAELAAVEESVLKLERELAAQRDKLLGLARSGSETEAQYEKLLQEKQKSEAAMREVLRTTWEVYNRKQSAGGPQLDEWPAMDRDYQWSASLFAALEEHRARIAEQEKMLGELSGRRIMIGREVAESMEAIELEKAKILAERLRYERRLADLRKQRQGAQAELDATVKLISSLNFDLQNAQAGAMRIDRAKGSLVWPAAGKLEISYRPSARPPVQGIGLSTAAGAPVLAAHGGKVMYNDTMRGLGRVVVLQHGEAYFTVYAFLSDSSVRQGDPVARGQELGKAGYYPALKGNGIYFELRHHQTTLNPELWLGPKS